MNSQEPGAEGKEAAAQAVAAGSPAPARGREAGAKPPPFELPTWWPIGMMLIVMTLAAYLPALNGGFVWDDDSWTTGIVNLLGSFQGLRWMWTHPSALQQYYPLSGTTFWLDYQLWGFWTLPYHVENVLLHGLAACVFWRLLVKLKVPGAWLGAAVFALHPLMVESAAWITERKNVLSMVLSLGSLYACGQSVGFWERDDSDRGTASGAQDRAWRLASILFFAAVLAKTTAYCIPAILLLLCWWKRGRLRWREDVLPTLPLFVVGIGFGVAVSWLEKHHLNAHGREWELSFLERCLVAGRAFWFYIGKVVWPANFCFLYPRWHPDIHSLAQWLYPITAVGALAALWLGRQRWGRGPLTAVLFYLGTIFPLLGFMNPYGMRYSFVWDHWGYFPSLGLIALAAAMVARLCPPRLLDGVSAALICLLGILTWRQCGQYADAETLWRVTIERNPAAVLAHNNLGLMLQQQGRVDEAADHYWKALAVDPDFPEAHLNIGIVLQGRGALDEAVSHYQRVIPERPDLVAARINYATILLDRGQADEAIGQLRKALEIFPDRIETLNNLALALLRKGDADEAMAHLRKALDLQPGFAPAHYNMGNALAQKGREADAMGEYEEALRLSPDFPDARVSLADTLSQLGRDEEAMGQYAEALRLHPDLPTALNNLAWLRATDARPELRDGAEAVRLAERACEATGFKQPMLVGTLAAAYAEAGQFEKAVQTARQAHDLALAAGFTDLAATNQLLMELYSARRPYHEGDNSVK